MKTAPAGLSLGRLPASACTRLPGDHPAVQGSQKPRRRVHVTRSLRRLSYGHVSRVSLRPEAAIVFSGTFPAGPGPWKAGATGLSWERVPEALASGAAALPAHCRDA